MSKLTEGMGANLFHHFHQRTDGAPATPSAQMAEKQYADAVEEIVAGADIDVVFEDMLEGKVKYPQDYKKGDRVRHKAGHNQYGNARLSGKGDGTVTGADPRSQLVYVKWDRGGSSSELYSELDPLDMSEASSSGVAYKGYLIRVHPNFADRVWIEKGGHLIGHAKSVEDAKRIIDHDLS